MNEAPIFIVGCPRSGTGLMRDLLRAHPSIGIPLESHFIPALYRAYGDPRNEREARRLAGTVVSLMDWEITIEEGALSDTFARSQSCAAVIDLAFGQWAREEGKRRWGDKTPNYVLELPTLVEMFPSCKVIHLVRDGRDVALSILRSHIGPENVLTAAEYWRRRVEAGRVSGGAMRPGTYHEVRYEDLLRDAESIMREVCVFVGEPFDPAVLVPDHIELQVRPLIFGARDHDVVSRTEIIEANHEKWKTRMDPGDREVFESIGGDLLRELGYEVENLARVIGPFERLRARLGNRIWNMVYRLNTGRKRRWAKTSLWMWRAHARSRLRRVGLVGPPPRKATPRASS